MNSASFKNSEILQKLKRSKQKKKVTSIQSQADKLFDLVRHQIFHSIDVRMFLANWFPRKAMWASASSVKSNMASFKKFFQWMGETGGVSRETVGDVMTTLKEGRDEFLESVAEF